MDEKTQKAEATVLEILRGSDRESSTEYKVRSAAADRLGIDLSLPDRKLFVRRIVEDHLRSLLEEEEQKQQAGSDEEGKKKLQEEEAVEEEKKVEEREEDEKEGGAGNKEFDDNGDLILCRLSTHGRVTLQEFRGMTLVSIRGYYLGPVW